MAHKDPIKKREYYLRWCEENKTHLKEYKKQYQAKNKNKIASYAKEYYENNKDKFVVSSWKSRGYPAPTRARPQVCECCKKGVSKKSLHLDHSHETNEFRGWLCTKCNMGIGALGDNIDGINKALEYLQRFQNERS